MHSNMNLFQPSDHLIKYSYSSTLVLVEYSCTTKYLSVDRITRSMHGMLAWLRHVFAPPITPPSRHCTGF